MKEKKNLMERVESVLETVRPSLLADGGNVELVDVTSDGIVKVKLVGAWHHDFGIITLC